MYMNDLRENNSEQLKLLRTLFEINNLVYNNQIIYMKKIKSFF